MDEGQKNLGELLESRGSLVSNEPQGELTCVSDDTPQNESSPIKHIITINPLDYGYTVTVGCQNFAFESSEQLMKRLGEYLKNPSEVSMTWTRTKKFK